VSASQLESEGLRFIDGKADAAARVSLGELEAARGRDAPAAHSAVARLAGVLPRVRATTAPGRCIIRAHDVTCSCRP
jgi:hypothetical protein